MKKQIQIEGGILEDVINNDNDDDAVEVLLSREAGILVIDVL